VLGGDPGLAVGTHGAMVDVEHGTGLLGHADVPLEELA
jgi:hypothetical protein